MTLKAIAKRAFDIIFSVLGLILCAPLMGLIAFAVRLDGEGKVIFTQKRIGQFGKTFDLYKFRKFPDSHGEKGPGVTMAKDIRMTRLGEILERLKLDELPQLWNILRGDMSFVGPRPESRRYQSLFEGRYEEILVYLPGIFGPNQVAFRNESEMYPPDRDPEEFYKNVLFPKKAETDLEYFKRANIWTDFTWIVKGIWASVFSAINWKRTVSLHARIVLLDIVAVIAAWTAANAIRFDGVPDDRNMDVFLSGLWLMPVVVVPLLMVSGCYRHPVRLFAVVDAVRLILVTAIAWVFAYLILMGFLYRHASMMLAPLGILLVLPIMVAPRIWWREVWRGKTNEQSTDSKQRILVYGAGVRGSAVVSLLQQGFPKARIVGFLDDDEQTMRGRVVQGMKVLGSERDIDSINEIYGIEQIWLTFIPDDHKYRRLLKWCGEKNVELIVLPATAPFAGLIQMGGDKELVRN